MGVNFDTQQFYLNDIKRINNRGILAGYKENSLFKLFIFIPNKAVKNILCALFSTVSDEYIESGFLALQQSIDSIYIELITGRTNFAVCFLNHFLQYFIYLHKNKNSKYLIFICPLYAHMLHANLALVAVIA